MRRLWPGFSQKDERGDFGLEQAKRLSFETDRFLLKKGGKKTLYEEKICPEKWNIEKNVDVSNHCSTYASHYVAL